MSCFFGWHRYTSPQYSSVLVVVTSHLSNKDLPKFNSKDLSEEVGSSLMETQEFYGIWDLWNRTGSENSDVIHTQREYSRDSSVLAMV